MEYKDGAFEAYYHGDGRVVESSTGGMQFQYKITDHLGNTVVLFEDKDGDGLITTESQTSDPNKIEVLERNLYYPFGAVLEGTWNSETDPLHNYRYNGKEWHGEAELGWLDFGFRYYDPAIGRFPSVDPIADQFAFVSPFNYAENSPVGHIDLWGLQKVDPISGEQGPFSNEYIEARDQEVSPDQLWSDGSLIPYDIDGYVLPAVTVTPSTGPEPHNGIGLTIDGYRAQNSSHSDFFDNTYIIVGTADALAANAIERISEYVRNRKFMGTTGEGPRLASHQVNRLKLRTPLGTIRGKNVVRLNNGLNMVARGAALYGYANIVNSAIEGDISPERAAVEFGVVTYAWRGGLPGAAVGFGYGVLGPWVTSFDSYQNIKHNYILNTYGGRDGLLSTDY